MKPLSIRLLACLWAVLWFALPASCASTNSKPAEPAAIVKYIVQNVLSAVGVKSPDQIESVIVQFSTQCTYKITRKDSPALVSKLYASLQPMRPAHGAQDTGCNGSMTFVLADGKALSMGFYYEPKTVPQTVYVCPSYAAPTLLETLGEIKTNAKAAELDARVGEFDAEALDVYYQRGGINKPWLPASSLEGQALVARARALVDWLDLRNARAVTVPDIYSARAKFGALTLYLKAPVRFTIQVLDEGTAPRPEPDPFGSNTRFDTFLCDRVVVLDYGNYMPPLLALRNMRTPNDYYLCPSLTRRAQEKYGVEKFGFPGHPTSDADYYTPPDQLYKSLQEYIAGLK